MKLKVTDGTTTMEFNLVETDKLDKGSDYELKKSFGGTTIYKFKQGGMIHPPKFKFWVCPDALTDHADKHWGKWDRVVELLGNATSISVIDPITLIERKLAVQGWAKYPREINKSKGQPYDKEKQYRLMEVVFAPLGSDWLTIQTFFRQANGSFFRQANGAFLAI